MNNVDNYGSEVATISHTHGPICHVPVNLHRLIRLKTWATPIVKTTKKCEI